MLKLPSSPSRCRPAFPPKTPLSPERRLTKKYRRAYIRKLKEREYRRLRAVVPAVAHKEKVSKVLVIEEAIRYIDELHKTLTDRIHDEELESCDCSTDEEIVHGAHSLFTQFHQSQALKPLSDAAGWSPASAIHNCPS